MNYQIMLEKKIEELQKEKKIPSLLLHSCCAPCSSYVLEYLSHYFKITVFYYNPNITELEEYQKRVKEQIRLIQQLPVENEISFLEGPYEPERFFEISKGLEEQREGESRCFKCYGLRLEKTAMMAKKLGYDFFTTTLSVSPYKNSEVLNRIGKALEDKYNVLYLYSDFKKKNGYTRSIALSKQYSLYRQDYCGCNYSKLEREQIKKIKQNCENRK